MDSPKHRCQSIGKERRIFTVPDFKEKESSEVPRMLCPSPTTSDLSWLP
ncbi:hypothetical protein ISN45_At01g040840 [Arabidopsis thaliana x Arabidopsis arenosa]|uniref:Uncharacterized protein n=2 Tax=Arabidopsis TaxID=3701 RepID=A0A5S9WQ29_ARATH|nr:hypothetical protein ISN45_At01g040840 [Arabidopsis thaliana x Arabidopsis arenosa]CAA0280046.1 unnamed protein product [Arabidopsis thaliana]